MLVSSTIAVIFFILVVLLIMNGSITSGYIENRALFRYMVDILVPNIVDTPVLECNNKWI